MKKGELHRSSLHQQLVELLEEGIREGRWSSHLPSEKKLCEDFQVSRVTLRRALACLVNEGVIELGGRGKHHRIVKVQSTPPPVFRGQVVRVLTPFSVEDGSTTDDKLLLALHQRISNSGFKMEVESNRSLFTRFRPSYLEELNSLPETAGWVSCYGTQAMHEWFAAHAKPTVVLGSVHEGISLPYIRSENSAAARHAAIKFSQCGHEEVVYLIANPTSLGDSQASVDFLAEARRLKMSAKIVPYDGTTVSLIAELEKLHESWPRPTGFLVGASESAVTTLCWLLAAGVQVPSEAGILAMWHDSNFSSTFPTIASYCSKGESLGRKVGQTLLDAIQHGTSEIRNHEILPEFIDGGSIGPLVRKRSAGKKAKRAVDTGNSAP